MPKHGDRIVIEVRAVNGLGKVGPSTFLAHVVDGPPSLGTGALQLGAATVIAPDFQASRSDPVNLGPLGVTSQQINSAVTYANDTGGAVEVEISWSAAHTVTVGASPAGTMSVHGAFITYTVNGSPGGSYTDPSGFDVPSITNSQTRSWRISNIWHLSLAAGSVLTVDTKVQFQGTANMTATLATTNAALRVTAIKR